MTEFHPLSEIEKRVPLRKPGFLEAYLALSTKVMIEGVEFRQLSKENAIKIRQEYALPLGEAVHAVAGPIGKAIHWPCMKGDGTTDLKPGSPCDKVKNALNKIALPSL